MKQIIELIELEIAKAFEQAGYGKELAKVTISNRPDLCEYQCNMALWREPRLIIKHQS